jgi:hypothetical protein
LANISEENKDESEEQVNLAQALVLKNRLLKEFGKKPEQKKN